MPGRRLPQPLRCRDRGPPSRSRRAPSGLPRRRPGGEAARERSRLTSSGCSARSVMRAPPRSWRVKSSHSAYLSYVWTVSSSSTINSFGLFMGVEGTAVCLHDIFSIDGPRIHPNQRDHGRAGADDSCWSRSWR
jgi:hypothetical protein